MTRHSMDWLTISVTPLSHGWINVFEYSYPKDHDEIFWTEPCPALLLQQRFDDEARETRVVAATFIEYGELDAVNDNHYLMTTQDEWEKHKSDAEKLVWSSRQQIRQRMLTSLTEAGKTGVSALDLVKMEYPADRAVSVRQEIEEEGLVTVKFEAGSMVYHLAKENAGNPLR